MFEEPKNGQFTQGTIFSCAHSEAYPSQPVHGLVITARCDAAQKKVPIYSFIPVVSLKHWMYRDGAEIALERHLLDLKNSQKGLLEAMEISPSVLRVGSVKKVIDDVLRPLAASDRKNTTRVEKFQNNQRQIEEIEAALGVIDLGLSPGVLSKSSKFTEQVLRELAGNRLMGFYLLRDMPTVYGVNNEHHVALLREVHHISNKLAERITQGISVEGWRECPLVDSKCPKFLPDEDFCVPVAKLRSPWMEHLMQTWALLFTRIGVEDVDFSSIKRAILDTGLEIS